MSAATVLMTQRCRNSLRRSGITSRPRLHVEKFGLRFGMNGDAVEARRQEDEAAGLDRNLALAMGKAQAALDQRDDLECVPAEVKSFPSFHFAGIDMKQ